MKEIIKVIKNNTENISFFSVLFYILYLILILILNIFRINVIDIIWPTINYLIGIIGIFLLIININKEKIKNNKIIIILIILFLLFGFLSSLLSTNKTISFLGSLYRNDGYIMYINYIMFIYLGYNIKDEKKKKELLLVLSMISSIILIFIKFNLLKINQYLFYNYNHLGYFLSISTISSLILFIDNKKINILYFVLFLINIIGLIYNNTFGSYLGVLISIILLTILLLIKKKYNIKLLISTIVFIILSIFISYKGSSIVLHNFNELLYDTNRMVDSYKENNNLENESIGKCGNRLELWINGIKFIKEKPLFGYGIENISYKYKEIKIYEDRPHNSLIQIALFQGIPSLIVYITLLIYLFIKNIKKEHIINIGILIICISYFISSLFGNSMYYTTPFYLLFIGILYKNTK